MLVCCKKKKIKHHHSYKKLQTVSEYSSSFCLGTHVPKMYSSWLVRCKTKLVWMYNQTRTPAALIHSSANTFKQLFLFYSLGKLSNEAYITWWILEFAAIGSQNICCQNWREFLCQRKCNFCVGESLVEIQTMAYVVLAMLSV